ncbi:ALP1-like protein [Tanacetum coccineum]
MGVHSVPPNPFLSMIRGDHGPDPFILLEAIASNDLWIWHAFFGVSGMNKDVNVLRQSPLFNDLKAGKALDVPFMANNVTYKRGYYPKEQHCDDDPVRTHQESMVSDYFPDGNNTVIDDSRKSTCTNRCSYSGDNQQKRLSKSKKADLVANTF